MQAEIIIIGDEILIGQIIDTNSRYICENLNAIGVSLRRITTIGDNESQIIETLAKAAKQSDLVLLSGGLGPTNDDVTKNSLCKYFGTRLVLDKQVLKDVENLILSRFGTMNELNRKQAEVPETCSVIRNRVGTAPILWFEKEDTIFVAMPGVPHELKHAMKNEIVPRIKTRVASKALVHRNILTTGIGESFLAATLAEWEKQLPANIGLAYLPSPGIVKLRLSGTGETKHAVQKQIDEQVEKLMQIVPEAIFSTNDESLEEIVGQLLLAKSATLSSAESCTGGNIAHLLTSIPGCSRYYEGSVVSYSNKVKENVLGISAETIEQYGAVSEQVVSQMAKGVREILSSDYAIATSGIAGPSGGSKDKPVGTTWIAVANKTKVVARKYNFGKNRERTIKIASLTALNMLRLLIIDDKET